MYRAIHPMRELPNENHHNLQILYFINLTEQLGLENPFFDQVIYVVFLPMHKLAHFLYHKSLLILNNFLN